MVTQNYKNYLAILICCGQAKTLLPGKTTNGTLHYIYASAGGVFGYSATVSLSKSASTAGIVFGSGNTPATEADYCLESLITDGISQVGSTVVNSSLDASGNPYVQHDITIENTSGSDIVIKEIGYQQTFKTRNVQYSTSTNLNVLLVDRTVLNTSVTIAAGETAAIRYIITTVVNAS